VFGARRVVLGEGDGLFLYTDGITGGVDASATSSPPAASKPVCRVHDLELEAIIMAVRSGDVKTFATGAQADDMTMVVPQATERRDHGRLKEGSAVAHAIPD